MKDCPKCGRKAVEVLNYETRERKGWFCLNPGCKGFEEAIHRERVINGNSTSKK